MTKTDMETQIMHLLGGRAAEKIVLKDVSTGASNDLERATTIARNMITKYGMSEKIGPINYSDADEVFLGRDFTSRKNFSESLASEIDKEIKLVMETAFEKTEQLLTEHLDELHRVAEALLELETIDGTQFEQLFNDESLWKRSRESLEQAKGKEFNHRGREAGRGRRADRKNAEVRRHMEKASASPCWKATGAWCLDLSNAGRARKRRRAAIPEAGE